MIAPLRRTSPVLLALAVLVLLPAAATAAPGDLDASFSGDGKARTDFASNQNDLANAVALQADGKIVAVGRTGGTGGRFALVRYDTDGTLDATFGGDGRVATNFTDGDDSATGVAIQADGKIVAVGRTDSRFAVARYDTDGTLDVTFGGDGKVTTSFGTGPEGARAVALQADGKIVAAGDANFDRFALARYDTDGTLDATFGGNGKVVTNFSIVSEWANGVVVQGDGKIVAAGAAEITEFSGTFALARYNSDGTLDTSFSGDGKVKTDFGAEQDVAFGVALQADGKIVAAGGGDVSGPRWALARYNTNGSLDTSFSGDGKVRTEFSNGLDAAHGVAVQADGKIVAAGHADFHRFAIARYDADGTLDTGFGGDGKVLTNFANEDAFGDDFANGVALQADGKIVAAGRAGGMRGRFALARYLAA